MASTKLIAVAHVTLEITNPANPSKLVAEAGENRSKKPLADWREAVDEAAAVVRHVQPEIGNRVRFNSGSGEVTVQYTSSPTRKTVQSLSRYMLTRELKEGPVPLSFSDDEKFRNIIVNRASIVTGFQRLDLNLNPTPGEAVGLSMLFTGDAYDRECDLRETMAEWRTGAQTRAVYKFDVIKIPHHGSDVTSSSDFYETFRDEVYLVCGAHEVHGNPKFSSISTIIRGFEGKRRQSGQPFRMFFSNPTADVSTDNYKSAALKVKTAFPPSDELHYEMWMLKAGANSEKFNWDGKLEQFDSACWGSVLFYEDPINGGLAEAFSDIEWKQI